MNTKIYLLIFLVLQSIFLLSATIAEIPKNSVEPSFFFHNYYVKDGLVQAQVFTCFQDDDGYIWIGTLGGLSRYDGVKFENFSLDDGLPSIYVVKIFQQKNGTIWIGTRNGAAIYENGKFSPYRFSIFKNFQPFISDIIEVPGKGLFFATYKGLLQLNNGKERLYTKKDGLLTNQVFSLGKTNDGVLIVGTYSGLNILKNGRISTYLPVNKSVNDYVATIRASRKSCKFYLTRPHRITIFDYRNGKIKDLNPPLKPNCYLSDTIEDQKGNVWIASSDGLYILKNDQKTFYHITKENGLPDNQVFQITIDYENNLWFSTDNGVAKLSSTAMEYYQPNAGNSDEIFWSIFPWKGKLLIGTSRGLRYLGKKRLSAPFLLKGKSITHIEKEMGDALLIGTDKGVYKFHNGKVEAVSSDKIMSIAFIYDLRKIGKDWFFASDHGLFMLGGKSGWIKLNKNIPYSIVQNILKINRKKLWLATPYGILILKYENNKWVLHEKRLLAKKSIQCFFKTKNGQIYVGTTGSGIYKYVGGDNFQKISLGHSLNNENIWAINEDKDGRLWVGTSHGVKLIENGHYIDFSKSYGVPQDEVSSNQSIYIDKKGNTYICLNKCLVVFKKTKATQIPPPKVKIISIEVNGEPIGKSTGPIDIKYNESLGLTFNCFSFFNEKANMYKYKLSGTNSDWSKFTTQRTIYFPRLPHGEYIFYLKAVNARGIYSTNTLSFKINVIPPFTASTWFYLLIIVILISLFLIVIIIKTSKDKREKIKLHYLIEKSTSKLRESEEKYRQLVEGALIGIAIFQEQKAVFVNPVFCSILKYRMDEVIGKEYSCFVHKDDLPVVIENLDLRMRGDKSAHQYELRAICSDGTIKNILVHTNSIIYEGKDAILVNFIDITEKKHLQEQLFHYQKIESIGTLAGGIAHDFNNILQGITGHISLIKMRLDEESPLLDDLKTIEEATAKAATLTRKLLGFARKGKYVVKKCDVHDIIDSVIKLSRRTIPLNIEFVQDYSNSPLYIEADLVQMEQVFLNLFLNAKDAMPGGGTIKITTYSENIDSDINKGNHILVKGPYVVIQIEDTGCGIKPEILPKIMDPFFTTKPHGKGSGLGLATVYGIVKNHHGFIYFDSSENQGTRVTIYFPRAIHDQNETTLADSKGKKEHVEQKCNPASLPQTQPLEGKQVLIAEDDAINRHFLKTFFTKYGAKIYEAENGLQAVTLFSSWVRKIDLVVLDINMPVMNGLDALKEIKKKDNSVPVLILSGYGEDAQIRKFTSEGTSDFIQKPIDAKKLLAIINKIFSTHSNSK